MLFWAANVSVEPLELCCAMILFLYRHRPVGPLMLCSRHKWSYSPGSCLSQCPHPVFSEGKPKFTSIFFMRKTALFRYRIIYPQKVFFLYQFLFNHWFYTRRGEIFYSFLCPPRGTAGYPRFITVLSLSASFMIYAGYFCQRYSNADQAAGCNCSVYLWHRYKQE